MGKEKQLFHPVKKWSQNTLQREQLQNMKSVREGKQSKGPFCLSGGQNGRETQSIGFEAKSIWIYVNLSTR